VILGRRTDNSRDGKEERRVTHCRWSLVTRQRLHFAPAAPNPSFQRSGLARLKVAGL